MDNTKILEMPSHDQDKTYKRSKIPTSMNKCKSEIVSRTGI